MSKVRSFKRRMVHKQSEINGELDRISSAMGDVLKRGGVYWQWAAEEGSAKLSGEERLNLEGDKRNLERAWDADNLAEFDLVLSAIEEVYSVRLLFIGDHRKHLTWIRVKGRTAEIS